MPESTSPLPVFLHGPLVDPEVLALVLGRSLRERDTVPAAAAGHRSVRAGDALAARLVATPGARAIGLVLARPSGMDRERLGRFAAPGDLVEAEVEVDEEFLIDAVLLGTEAGAAGDGSPEASPAAGLADADRPAYLERLRAWLGQVTEREGPAA